SCRETQPLNGGECGEGQLLKIRNQAQLAGETLARFAGGPALKHADFSPTGKDFAFGLHEQGSERGSLALGRSGAEVFDHLSAEQIERRIREREDAERTRDFETYLIHHELLIFSL